MIVTLEALEKPFKVQGPEQQPEDAVPIYNDEKVST